VKIKLKISATPILVKKNPKMTKMGVTVIFALFFSFLAMF